MMKMQFLADLAPEDVPEASRFLLEINFTELLKSHIETQNYLTLAVNAALAAQDLECARGARDKWIRSWTNVKMHSWQKLGLIAIEQRIQKDGMHRSPTQNNSTHRMDHTQTSLESYICKHPPPRCCDEHAEVEQETKETGLTPTNLSQLCRRLHT